MGEHLAYSEKPFDKRVKSKNSGNDKERLNDE